MNGVALTGTTTILDVLGKNLTWWAAEMAAISCLEAGEKIPTIRKEYLEACASEDKKKAIDALQKKYPAFKKARFAHFDDKNTKADKGTDLHADLEKLVKAFMAGESIPMVFPAEKAKLMDFCLWAKENVSEFIASEVNVYDKILFIGGIVDCIAKLKDGTYAIIDFKSSKEVFFGQMVQCSLYGLQLARNGAFNANGDRLLDPLEVSSYIVFPFGAKELKPVQNKNIKSLTEAAEACVSLYRQKAIFEN